jgi:fumarate reductase flavoprotein subunit
MDNKHIAKGMQCETCHTPFPPTSDPDMAVCLKCHTGSYDKLGELTAKIDPNPHKSHEGQIPCANCHTAHGPFVYGCGQCHPEYTNSRFK